MIDPGASIGAVHLTISDLDRSVRFYETHLGFLTHHRDDRTARLGAGGADLLVLSPSATAPRARGTTGLYHFAILVPTRADLSRGTIIGHVHLHVAHLDEAEEFYVGGLRHFVVKLPSESALASVTERVRVAGLRIEDADAGLLIHDPSKNAILLSVM